MKYTLKNGLLVLCLMLFAGTTFSQSRLEKDEKIKAQKIAFITTALELTPKESQLFWPLYNEYEKRENELKSKIKRKRPEMPLDDASAKQKIEEIIMMEENRLNMKKEYVLKYEEAIGYAKVLKLWMAEKEFTRMVLEKFKHRRKQRGEKRD